MILNNLHIALCDDEQSALDRLHSKLEKACPPGAELEIDTFLSAADLLQAYQTAAPYDCIFLDVLIGTDNGIDVAKKLRDAGYKGILLFVSNTEYYALKGYAVNAYGYFIKPISTETLSLVLDAAMARYSQTKILISTKRKLIAIVAADIKYIESYGKTLSIVTKEGMYTTNSTMYNIESQLDVRNFVRCHKGYIVNFNYVSELTPTDIVLDDKELIPIGRSYKNEVKNRFLAYLRLQ